MFIVATIVSISAFVIWQNRQDEKQRTSLEAEHQRHVQEQERRSMEVRQFAASHLRDVGPGYVRLGSGCGNPSYLTKPYPSPEEMEQALGTANLTQHERLGTNQMAELNIKSSDSTVLYWWLEDPKSKVTTQNGDHPGYKLIMMATFVDDRLAYLQVGNAFSSSWEAFGRTPLAWGCGSGSLY